MQKRLKSSTKVEQRDFNCKRFEEENPFYINAQIGSNSVNLDKYEDEEGVPRQ